MTFCIMLFVDRLVQQRGAGIEVRDAHRPPVELAGLIAAIIRKDFPDLPDAEKDLADIDSLMAEGHYMVHVMKERDKT